MRINDRGPYAPGRIIDLSKAAAKELGMMGLGIKPVEIWRLAKNEQSCPDVQVTSARPGKQVASAKGERRTVSAKAKSKHR